MPFLELVDLHKSFDGAPLLCGVSFTVARGEIACLLGPSGSGKTTLLRLIAGLEEPEAGRIVLDGVDLTGVPTHRRNVGLMFQDYALFPHQTVAENVAFGLKYQETGNREQGAGATHHAPRTTSTQSRVDAMLALVGLEGFGPRDVNLLSGGERQRVALARSLAPRPRLLLLDEPLGALDRTLREQLLEELPHILREVGVTAITVTHDQEEAFALADRVVLLHAGRVAQSGTPEAVYDQPATAWSARFLGLDNLFPATVQAAPQVSTPLGALTLAPGTRLPAPGCEGMLLIHPWGVRLGSGPVNRFTAHVSGRSYHGGTYRLQLTLPGGRLTLTRPLGEPLPTPGTEITGWLEPAALRWLAE